MVVKVYVSGLSGNKEVKKRQQRVLMILDSKSIKYDVVDITEPANEDQRDFMRDNCTNNSASGDNKDSNGKAKPKFVPIPPQIFNDEVYCGDYDGFDIANEIDKLEEFLKVERIETNGEQYNKQEEIVSKQNEINSAVSDVIDKISTNNIDEDFVETNTKNENDEEIVQEVNDEKVEEKEDTSVKEENEDEKSREEENKEGDEEEEKEEEEEEEEE